MNQNQSEVRYQIVESTVEYLLGIGEHSDYVAYKMGEAIKDYHNKLPPIHINEFISRRLLEIPDE